MGSNPIERKKGTLAWRVENVRVELGFKSQEEFKVFLDKKFRGSAYTDFLRYAESENPTLKQAAFVEDRLERLTRKLPADHMEYVRSGNDGPVPKKPDDFDPKEEYNKAIKARQAARSKAEQQSMGRHFKRITRDDEKHSEIFSPLDRLDMLVRNGLSFDHALEMVKMDLITRGRQDVVAVFEGVAKAAEMQDAYGEEPVAVRAGSRDDAKGDDDHAD